MIKITTNKAPKALGPYSQAVDTGEFLFTSGQIAIDPETSKIIDGNIEEQTHRVMKNLMEIIKESNYKKENIVKATCFLKDLSDFVEFNQVYAQYIDNKPARSCVQVAKLPLDALCEVELIVKK